MDEMDGCAPPLFTLLFRDNSTIVVSKICWLLSPNEKTRVSPPSNAGYLVYSKELSATLIFEIAASNCTVRSYTPVDEPKKLIPEAAGLMLI